MTAVAFQAPAREPTARAIDRRKIVRTSSDVARPLADAPRLPATRIHPLAIWTPLAAYSWLILAACVTFAGGETSLVLAFVVLISMMFLGGMALPAFMGRNMEPEREQDRSFRAFWNGEADIATGGSADAQPSGRSAPSLSRSRSAEPQSTSSPIWPRSPLAPPSDQRPTRSVR